MRILAIDDTRTLRELLCRTLRGASYDVVEAENGEEGLVRFADHRPDIVITDLNMPVLDGIEFTRAVRSRADGGVVPIIILTTESGAEIKAEGRKAGATAWMVKPFDPQRLLDMLTRFKK
ncbi:MULTISPECIES: response regulator [unclassified Alsobacter]|uniref:Response regulator n=1 Tax=Alsobacter sp. KACC 23698 TaxID=3149229 RepID=A0AAU7JIM2_9HYPH